MVTHIPLSQLRQMPGAGDLEDAWLRARLGEDGYLTGKDAEAAACDAQTIPVVTGIMDPSVIDQMIDLARTGAEATAADDGPAADSGNDTADPAATGQAAECLDGRDETPGQGSPDRDGFGPATPRHHAAQPSPERVLYSHDEAAGHLCGRCARLRCVLTRRRSPGDCLRWRETGAGLGSRLPVSQAALVTRRRR